MPPSVECVDTDNGALGSWLDDCTYHTSHPSSCGQYDDKDFVASQMCCACGGGTTGNIHVMLSDINIYS